MCRADQRCSWVLRVVLDDHKVIHIPQWLRARRACASQTDPNQHGIDFPNIGEHLAGEVAKLECQRPALAWALPIINASKFSAVRGQLILAASQPPPVIDTGEITRNIDGCFECDALPHGGGRIVAPRSTANECLGEEGPAAMTAFATATGQESCRYVWSGDRQRFNDF